MSKHYFGTPYSVTSYTPRYFFVKGTHDGVENTIQWDGANTKNVLAELEHLVECLRGNVSSMRVVNIHDNDTTNKIKLIKKIREDLGIGLYEAKQIADGNDAARDLSEAQAREFAQEWSVYGEIAIYDALGTQIDRYDLVPF